MSEDNPAPKRSKTPTWVGHVVKAKDDQIAAMQGMAEGKERFLRDRLKAEYEERTERSEALYKLAKERADDQSVTIKRLWIANIFQALIIAALAGVTVGMKTGLFGDMSLDSSESGQRGLGPRGLD